MGKHFHTVVIPRIKKITYTPAWKADRPERVANSTEAQYSPRIVKYMCLESYEDALSNIEFDSDAQLELDAFDDYLLKYMLKWETKRAERC